jgi:hypothetical protein
LARRAQARARSLGASDVIADALNTEGCAVCATDPNWVELIRRSLELAISRNLPNQAVHVCVSAAVFLVASVAAEGSILAR